MTIDELRRLLGRDEPDYSVFLTPESEGWRDMLWEIVKGDDEALAAAACYALVLCGGLVGDGRSRGTALTGDPRILVRLALAAALIARRGHHPELVAALMEDADDGVRKLAIRAAAGTSDPGLLARLHRLRTQRGIADHLREAASDALKS